MSDASNQRVSRHPVIATQSDDSAVSEEVSAAPWETRLWSDLLRTGIAWRAVALPLHLDAMDHRHRRSRRGLYQYQRPAAVSLPAGSR